MSVHALFPVLLACLFIRRGLAEFNLYPGVNADRLAKSLNISTACVQALWVVQATRLGGADVVAGAYANTADIKYRNQTIPQCDQTLLQMAQSLENYWWTDDNVTDICASGCSTAVSEWNGAAAAACDEQYFTAYGRLVPIWTVTERFVDNVNFACLESWSENYTYCLTESQEWVGADVPAVDCAANPSDPTCVGGGVRMANLYEDSILYARVTSQFLPDSDHSDYLVEQLFDIQDVCNVSLPEFTVRLPDTYDNAAPLTSTYLGTSSGAATTTATSAPPAATTCLGQAIGHAKRADSSDWLGLFGISSKAALPVRRDDASNCDSVSRQYGVGSGALQRFLDGDTCNLKGDACLPLPCKLLQVSSGDTCASIAAAIEGNITLSQFMSWNKYILGLCDALTAGQLVCVSSPGNTGKFSLPPPPLGTAADANNQQRGGAGGVVTPTSTIDPGATANPVSGGSAPSPTQDGLVSNCNNYASATAGQGCYDFATRHRIEPSQLYAWNPVLGADGRDCTTALWASEYYCVGTRTVPATTVAPAPGPTQSGIAPGCSRYARAVAGDSCDAFAARNQITNAQLYAWNAVLGSRGENCGTQLWAEEYYCVGVASTGTPAPTTTTTTTTTRSIPTTTTSRVAAPGPTQSGIVANCVKFAEADGGLGCYDFAAANGITTAQLYAWNTVLGANGENCGSAFWAKEYYCVGVSS